jgi:predicted RNA-binding protein YlxR (DUF448 family)
MTDAPLVPPSKSSRTCAGCGEAIDLSAEKDGATSVRVVRGPDGSIAVDAKGGAFGRGAHVHTRPECIAKAAQRGLARSFKAACEVTPASLANDIAAALDRRIEGLLISAVRTRAVAIGSDAASGAIDRRDAQMVLVATDAAAAAELSAVRVAVAAGRAVAWGTKLELGALTTNGKKPEGVGVIAILSDRLGWALADAVRAKNAALAASDDKFNPRRARGQGETAREAANASITNQAERGA